MKRKRSIQCALCKNFFKNSEMSEEHYPAKSTGNDDIVALDFGKMIDSIMSGKVIENFFQQENQGKTLEEVSSDFFDEELSHSLYPKGRTARSLCRECNTFFGKYDESYKKFYDNGGSPSIIKGYQKQTRLKIIKAIFAKFLSVPECKGWKFDFVDFLKNESQEEYKGKWKLYCVKRDYSTDMLGLGHLATGELTHDEGTIFELSDEKFIFHLMDFEPHEGYKSLNMMDLLNKTYTLVNGSDLQDGGYHGELMIQDMLFNNMSESIY
ncbi:MULTISPECIES: hypothetical protein [Carnobacterium]|uniref:hypothetical protein n=1 Tax=Carnobacterium sp. FSL W8-0810 TaxID=2954705 RepID=UPI0030F9B95D